MSMTGKLSAEALNPSTTAWASPAELVYTTPTARIMVDSANIHSIFAHTFSLVILGTHSLKLEKLSFIWSRLFLSSAL